jgi:hypothetical protein
VWQQRFADEIKEICARNQLQQVEKAIVRYFDRYWFSDLWREHVLDEGLPAGQTRDGPWNTNNWIESSFRTFGVVFLESRKNKR